MGRNTYFVADDITAKILLLFIFEKMEIPLTESTLTEIITENPDWLSYMDYKIALAGIMDSKFVIVKTISGKSMYQLSQDGRMCLSHFFTKIPASIREQIIQYVGENKLKMKRNQEYTFDYFKNSDATHTAVLKIKSDSMAENLIEIRLNLPTRTDALRATSRWKTVAPKVFETIWEILIEKDDKEDEIKNKGDNKDAD
jgi:hypothetical protein